MKKKLWIILGIVLGTLTLIGLAVGSYFIFRCEHEWEKATCSMPAICSECKKTDGEPLGHDWLEADCTRPKTCSRCEKTKGEVLEHLFEEATCATPQKCSVCGLEEGEVLPHTWTDAVCAAPKTCSVCKATEGEALGHDWKEATCLAVRTCNRCQATEGELAAHTFTQANCIKPATCTCCGITEGTVTDHQWAGASCTLPKTCKICKKTEGSALGHVWQEATCTTPKMCTVCKLSTSDSPGHIFVKNSDGKTKHCQVCGQDVTIKYIAITFDDGPSGEVTQTLLNGLAQRNVRATFFLCGYRIKIFPGQPQTIAAQGHELALHTMDHASLPALSEAGIRAQLEGMLSLLPAGSKISLMRPPGGAYNDSVKKVCKDLGLSVIMWSTDPLDWATGDAATVASRVTAGAQDGGIILLHDLRMSSVQGALRAIDRLQALGYEFVTVSELAAIKGKPLQPGEVYYSCK